MRLVPQEPAVRNMALATLVNTTGNGIFFTLSALYFTPIVGFSVVEVGTGLSIAAGVAIFAGVPLGHLAAGPGHDRLAAARGDPAGRGPRHRSGGALGGA